MPPGIGHDMDVRSALPHGLREDRLEEVDERRAVDLGVERLLVDEVDVLAHPEVEGEILPHERGGAAEPVGEQGHDHRLGSISEFKALLVQRMQEPVDGRVRGVVRDEDDGLVFAFRRIVVACGRDRIAHHLGPLLVGEKILMGAEEGEHLHLRETHRLEVIDGGGLGKDGVAVELGVVEQGAPELMMRILDGPLLLQIPGAFDVLDADQLLIEQLDDHAILQEQRRELLAIGLGPGRRGERLGAFAVAAIPAFLAAVLERFHEGSVYERKRPGGREGGTGTMMRYRMRKDSLNHIMP